jgi:hypothetical protein
VESEERSGKSETYIPTSPLGKSYKGRKENVIEGAEGSDNDRH